MFVFISNFLPLLSCSITGRRSFFFCFGGMEALLEYRRWLAGGETNYTYEQITRSEDTNLYTPASWDCDIDSHPQYCKV